MSDNSDDDIWARVRAETATKTRERAGSELRMEPSERSASSLERRPISEPSTKMTWETTGEEIDGPPPPKRKKRAKQTAAPTILIGSTIVSLLWVLTVGSLLIQNANKFGIDSSSFLTNVLMLLLGPALALLAGFMGEGIAKSNREARHLINAARRMLEPEQTGETAVRTTAMAVRSEIGRLEGAIGDVADRLRLIESSVENQTKALSAAGHDARGGADQLVASMEGERQRLDTLLAAMAELTSQAQASTQLATQSIEDRAAKLAIAADSLVDKSTQASEVAAGAAQRLDSAAQRAVSAIEQLDIAAGRGESALARAHDLMVLARLRADEAVGNVSSAVSSLNDAATSAAQTAQTMSETVSSSTSASRDAGLAQIEEIRAATIANAELMTQALRIEAEAARTAGAETLNVLQASAEAVRFAADEARQQVNEQMADNQRRLDGVRQTAFEAGKDADAFVDKRMTDARALIEQSAGLLDETGNKIQERFSRLAAACADQARAVEDLLDGLDRRLADLPHEADARARAIEEALNDTLSRLTQAGRQAADETAALDHAFQDRLRDSYSALGEVVQRLGGLSGVVPMPIAMPAPSQALGPVPSAQVALKVEATTQIAPAMFKLGEPIEMVSPSIPSPAQAPNMQSQPVESKSAPNPISAKTQFGDIPQQPALKLEATTKVSNNAPEQVQPAAPRAPVPQPAPTRAPTQAPTQPKSGLKISSPVPIEDDPFAELQIGRAPTASSELGGGWSWKQVLSTLDAKGAKNEANRIDGLMTELGLGSAIEDKTLDRLRGMASRSRDQARRGTRELLADQVRAMRRKLASDPELRASIVRFVEERRELAARGRLNGDEARVYLVADAALEA
jgi:hypothetical protein